MNGNMILLLPMILPLIAGLITGFLKEEKQCNLWVFIVMAVEAGLVWMLAFGDYTLEVWRFTDRLVIAYHTDGLAKFFACLISTVWLLAAVFSMEYMKHEHKPARFFMFYILSLGALMSLCFSANMMTMYLSYEYMTVLTLPLVIHTGTPEAVRAGMKYLGYSMFGAGLGLMGFFFLNTYCVTTDFMPGGTLDMSFINGRENMMLAVFFLMSIGFGCKAGMFPLHAWLPTAHPVAPSPASAVLSGIITKAGIQGKAAEKTAGIFYGQPGFLCPVRADAAFTCGLYGGAASGSVPCNGKEHPVPFCGRNHLQDRKNVCLSV